MKKKLIRGILLLCLLLLPVFPACAQDEQRISDGVFIGEKDISGMTVEEVEAYVEEEVSSMASSTITLRMGDNEVTTTREELGFVWTNTDLVQEVSELGTTGNIVRRYKEQKDLENQSSHFKIEYQMDEADEEDFVRSLSAYNSEPVEGSVYQDANGALVVSGGTDGLTLDVDATLSSLKDYLATEEPGNAVIRATSDAVSPVLTAELLSKMTDVLGTATTDYSASSADRRQNVENGTSMINGTLLMPGETFSVTSAVTPFTAENGYALAPSYEAGSVVDSYGGGICQVSTTLYNAVLKAELEVDQRSNHTMTVSYVDPSKDAAIAEGTMDFVFTNTSEYPIYIAGSAYYGSLTFTIYGVETRPANRTIKFVSETLSTTDAATNLTLVAKTDQNVGYLYQSQTPHQGLSAVLWKEIYYDGVLSETVQVNSSYYFATPAIYEVGVVTSNEALYSAMLSAIAANDLAQVQSLISNGVTESEETSAEETTAEETTKNDISDEVQAQIEEERAAAAAAAEMAQENAQAPADTDPGTGADASAEPAADDSADIVVVE